VTAARQLLGAAAERIASERLAAAGWRIAARNVRTRYGEIDIVALDGDTLVFVEVKAGREGGLTGPEYPALAVGPDKQRRLRRLAAGYLAGRPPLPRFEQVRFDVIGISFSPGGEIAGYDHIEFAF
jgi:putative endonuclease